MLLLDLVRRCRPRTPLLALAAAALVALAACSPTPTPTPHPSIVPVPTSKLVAVNGPHLDADSKAALQRALNLAISRYVVVGGECAVIFPDGSMWTGTAGVAVLATRQPWTDDTLLDVGSISKTFTGALAVRLAQRGIIGIDDPLSTYLPEYPNAPKITIRQLMNHTSGIRDLFEAGTYNQVQADKNRVWTVDELLATIGRPYFAPGTDWRYSSTNYVILGKVLELVTGEKLATMVRREFLEPLGMNHTFLQWEEAPVGPFAHGYVGTTWSHTDVSVGQSLLPYVSAATATGASGGVVSTASDIARWAKALYDGSVFDQATLASVLDTSWTVPFNPHFPYGLTVEQFDLGGRVGWGHRGHLDGFWSTMAYLPQSGVTIALLTNADYISSYILTLITNIVATVAPAPTTAAGTGLDQDSAIAWPVAA